MNIWLLVLIIFAGIAIIFAWIAIFYSYRQAIRLAKEERKSHEEMYHKP